eukprot:SAG31_NODE_2543_length_5534_cov_9.026311_3_plen_154_part_00
MTYSDYGNSELLSASKVRRPSVSDGQSPPVEQHRSAKDSGSDEHQPADNSGTDFEYPTATEPRATATEPRARSRPQSGDSGATVNTMGSGSSRQRKSRQRPMALTLSQSAGSTPAEVPEVADAHSVTGHSESKSEISDDSEGTVENHTLAHVR